MRHPHESTGVTPHKMVFGIEMKLLLDILSENITEKCEFRTDYAENLKIRLCETHDFARKCLQKSSERQ